jgi:ribosomal protein L30E
MSSGKITVGARKTAARVRTIKNKNPLQKKNTVNYLLQRFYYYTLVICLSKTI